MGVVIRVDSVGALEIIQKHLLFPSALRHRALHPKQAVLHQLIRHLADEVLHHQVPRYLV